MSCNVALHLLTVLTETECTKIGCNIWLTLQCAAIHKGAQGAALMQVTKLYKKHDSVSLHKALTGMQCLDILVHSAVWHNLLQFQPAMFGNEDVVAFATCQLYHLVMPDF